MFIVKVSRKADKISQTLDEKTQERVLHLFTILENSPVPTSSFDVTKLTNSKNGYRVRIGDIRILYFVFWKENAIEVTKIERKKDRTYK